MERTVPTRFSDAGAERGSRIAEVVCGILGSKFFSKSEPGARSLSLVLSWLYNRGMCSDSREQATTSLRRLGSGDRDARNHLFELLYTDLRRQADALLRKERSDHTLQPTALVNEAWLRLIDPDVVEVNDRRHFMALAARAMRRVLVDHARSKSREKRGSGWQRIELGEDVDVSGREQLAQQLDLAAVDRALARLEKQSERMARIVELRFFGGLSREAAADVLGTSRATVARDWRVAKAVLARLIREEETDS